MDSKRIEAKEKIILPKNLQREMMKFFLQKSMQKNTVQDKEKQTSEISKEEC